jgi:hypothetical protein
MVVPFAPVKTHAAGPAIRIRVRGNSLTRHITAARDGNMSLAARLKIV